MPAPIAVTPTVNPGASTSVGGTFGPSTTRAATTAVIEPGGTTTSTPAPTIVKIGTLLWWNAFEIHLTTATFTPDPNSTTGSGALLVAGTVKNLKEKQRSFADRSEDVTLTASGHSGSNVQTFDSAVPGGGALDFTLGYRLDAAFDPTATTLTFGDSTATTSTAQLSPGGPVHTVEPRRIAGGAKAKTSVLQLEVTGGSTDASYVSGQKGQYVVHLALNVTYTGQAAGGYYLAATQFKISTGNGVIASNPIEVDDLSATPLRANAPATQTAISFLLPAAAGSSVTVTYSGMTDVGTPEKTAFDVKIG